MLQVPSHYGHPPPPHTPASLGARCPLSALLASSSVRVLASRVRLFMTPWTVARQAPPSMGFSSQEYWSELPFPSPGDLLDPGIKSRSPSLQADSLTSALPGTPRSADTGFRHLARLPCKPSSISRFSGACRWAPDHSCLPLCAVVGPGGWRGTGVSWWFGQAGRLTERGRGGSSPALPSYLPSLPLCLSWSQTQSCSSWQEGADVCPVHPGPPSHQVLTHSPAHAPCWPWSPGRMGPRGPAAHPPAADWLPWAHRLRIPGS